MRTLSFIHCSSWPKNAEYELNRLLASISKDSTVIFITHRLSTVQMADRILVMDKGEIVEDGPHTQLLAAHDSKYSKLWNLQAQYYQQVK